MCEQLREFLNKNNILPDIQSGFRPMHSCCTALVNVTDDILRARDMGKITALMLFDFSKAFDMVNYNLLLAICHHIGIGPEACQLISSYLDNRQQTVHLSNTVSSLRRLSSGVPQGSILGPLLFTVYTSALPTYLTHCSAHLYADDTQLYYSFHSNDMSLAIDIINKDIESLLRFARYHCLNINPLKTQCLLFGPRHILQGLSELFGVKVDGVSISPSPEARNLGVVFDDTLRFRTHITRCIRSGYSNLKLIYNKRKFLDVKLKSLLCDTLVLSRLNYCDCLYGPNIDSRDARRIQVLQNACLRLIYGVRRRRPISHKLASNRWLNMANRRFLHAASFYHSVLLHKCPPYLYERITFRSDVHNVHIRFKGTLSIPAHKTESFKWSFTYQIAKVYNSLPDSLKTLPLKKFKSCLKRDLLVKQNSV